MKVTPIIIALAAMPLAAPAQDTDRDGMPDSYETANGLNPALDDVDGDIDADDIANGFEFLMVDSADHVSPKTGLTVSAERSIDGTAFQSVTGSAPTEVSDGIYVFNGASADTNGDRITWRFSASGADDTFVTFNTVV